MEITVNNKAIIILDNIPWSVLKKIMTAQFKQDLGQVMTELVVGVCVSPKYTYESIDKADGMEICLLGQQIAEELHLDEKLEMRAAELKKADSIP